VTRTLALQVIEAEHQAQPLEFPNEGTLCQQLGVSRSILRESVKVLEDKGMIEVRPRSGTRARPRAEWNQLDPSVLGWQAQLYPDALLLRNLCEVRLAIEPTAAGFAAVRATEAEVASIESCLERREAAGESAAPEEAVELDLQFQAAVVEASHNPMFQYLNAILRQPLRTALSYTVQLPASERLGLAAHRSMLEAIHARHPIQARAAAEEIVALAMLAVEQVIRNQRHSHEGQAPEGAR
jgi:DNA-binding FadR family transcriptional regulator